MPTHPTGPGPSPRRAPRHRGARGRGGTRVWRGAGRATPLLVVSAAVGIGIAVIPFVLGLTAPSSDEIPAASRRLDVTVPSAPESASPYLLGRRVTLSRGASRTAPRATPPRPASWLVGCGSGDAAVSHGNGVVPLAELCALPDDDQALHPDAARAWSQLVTAYRAKFGVGPCVTDSYRSLQAQQRLYALKPGLAATPGTSNHGWGVAVDLCGGVESFSTPEHLWLRSNAPAFGWVLPAWAQERGSRPEPWHWEYRGSSGLAAISYSGGPGPGE